MAIQISKEEYRKIMRSCNQHQIDETKQGGKMNNKLTDLNNYLFEQLERLNDDELSEEEFEKELKRSKAVTDISSNIIHNAKTVLEAQKFYEDIGFNAVMENSAKMLIGEGPKQDEKIQQRTN